MRSELWRLAFALAVFAATSIACDGNCDEPAPIVAGEYIVGERLYGGDEVSDDWTQAVAPGAELSVDRANESATLVYELDGTTYQVAFTLEK